MSRRQFKRANVSDRGEETNLHYISSSNFMLPPIRSRLRHVKGCVCCLWCVFVPVVNMDLIYPEF